jgi:hypothetical protein
MITTGPYLFLLFCDDMTTVWRFSPRAKMESKGLRPVTASATFLEYGFVSAT